MKTSQKGIDLIKKFEGLKLYAYLCPANVWTIGYGTTKDVKPGMTITEIEAENLLKRDLEKFENQVNSLNLPFNQNQFDAIVSFTYNLGFGNLKSSTLLKKATANVNDDTIRIEFLKWVYAGGKKLEGLVKRRAAEHKLYFGDD